METLPITQRVDFAELVDLTELLTAKTVPNGTYVRAILRLDYSEADVSVEAAGLPVEALVVDENGDPLEIVDLELELDNANQVVVVPGTPALLQLDFDLAASHEVDITTTPATAVGEPFLFATIEPVDLLKFRVRGPLVSVDEAAGSYVVDLRPFNHPDAELGRFTVHTTADYRLRGGWRGHRMAPRRSPPGRCRRGHADGRARHLGRGDACIHGGTGSRGDSVPGANFDVVIGNVVARDGNELSVRGATIVRRDGRCRSCAALTVQIGSNTVVTQEGDGATTCSTRRDLGRPAHPCLRGCLRRGQRRARHARCDARPRAPASHAPPGSRDSGEPRQRSRSISCDRPAPSRGVRLLRHRRDRGDGCGSARATRSSRANMSLDDRSAGAPARVFGFVTPFGTAPPDFTGRTLVAFEAVLARCVVGWGEGGTRAPFSSMNPSGLVIDAANREIGLRHHIAIGPRLVDILSLATPVHLVPDRERRGTFAIATPGTVEVFADFGEFQASLAEKLATSKAIGITSTGRFDAATGDFRTARILVSPRAVTPVAPRRRAARQGHRVGAACTRVGNNVGADSSTTATGNRSTCP